MRKGESFMPMVICTLVMATIITLVANGGWIIWLPVGLALYAVWRYSKRFDS